MDSPQMDKNKQITCYYRKQRLYKGTTCCNLVCILKTHKETRARTKYVSKQITITKKLYGQIITFNNYFLNLENIVITLLF